MRSVGGRWRRASCAATAAAVLGAGGALAAPAPRDRDAPLVITVAAGGQWITVRYAERIRLGTPRRASVSLNGRPVRVVAAHAAGKALRLRLGSSFYSDDVLSVRLWAGYVRDRAGNASRPLERTLVRNGSPTGCTRDLPPGAESGEGPTDRTVHPPSTGELRVVAIPVDFPNVPEQYGFVPPISTADFVEFFLHQSYGRLHMPVTVLGSWHRMPRVMAAYGLDQRDLTYRDPTRVDLRTLLADAVAAADASIDFSAFDVVAVLTWGSWVNAGAALPPGRGVHADGKELRFVFTTQHWMPSYALPVGRILGIPWLWRPGWGSPFGTWDGLTIASPAETNAWHRRKLGWLGPDQVRCIPPGSTLETTLTPVWSSGGPKAVLSFAEDGESAVVVEARRRGGHDRLKCGEGVLVYHVATDPARIRVVDAHPTERPCGAASRAPFGVGETYLVGDLRMDVLADDGPGYRIRFLRAPGR